MSYRHDPWEDFRLTESRYMQKRVEILKIMVLFGTRPEAIKLAPVVHELRRRSDEFDCVVGFSGQHRDIGLATLASFGLVPDFELETMTPGQSLNRLASRLLGTLDTVLEAQRPDWLLVQGDTTTAMAGALAGFFARIRVGHVEAGLRTHDRFSPFPEEVNRQVTGRVADLHFAPTERAASNLRAEGVSADSVVVTGNTVVDALFWMRERLPAAPPEALAGRLSIGEKVVLVTCHRRESFGFPMERVCRAVARLAAAFPQTKFVLPMHPNPVVRATVESVLGGVEGVLLLPPLDYPDLLWCIQRSSLILSDSGGIQEEAPSFQKPLLILRESTERPEVVEAGAGVIVGTDEDEIVRRGSGILGDPAEAGKFEVAVNPFGDGNAAARIADSLLNSTIDS